MLKDLKKETNSGLQVKTLFIHWLHWLHENKQQCDSRRNNDFRFRGISCAAQIVSFRLRYTLLHLGMIALPWASLMNWHLCWWKGHAPRLASPALDTSITLVKNFFWASFPLHVSRILDMISKYSPTVVQSFQGQPPPKAGHLAAMPFISWGSSEYGHAPPLKAGHFSFSSEWLTAKGAWSKGRGKHTK